MTSHNDQTAPPLPLPTPLLDFRTNLRGNLILWPVPSRNIKALLQSHDTLYDEDAMLARIELPQGEKRPTDTRSVRNTAEVLAMAGMAQKRDDLGGKYILTNLGKLYTQFIGTASRPLANADNIHLLAGPFVKGMSSVLEYRMIWSVMLENENYLSNEELNRIFMAARTDSTAVRLARLVKDSRVAGDPQMIGPRAYDNEGYSDSTRRSEQRKAMNPWFLLAGAGGILISIENEARTIQPWALPLMREALAETVNSISLTKTGVCAEIANISRAPEPLTF